MVTDYNTKAPPNRAPDEHEWPRVGLVTLNWNGAEDTIALLRSLAEVTYEQLEVVVVDNASSDDSVQLISKWLDGCTLDHRVVELPSDRDATAMQQPGVLKRPLVTVLVAPDNLGFCRGNNLGLEWSFAGDAQFALVLNNDTLVRPDFLHPLVDVARSPNVGLVGGLIAYSANPDTIWWAGGKLGKFLQPTRLHDGDSISVLQHRAPFETEWVSGCMTFVPAHVYHRLGGFDEQFFIWGEEWDYSVRVAAAGYKLMVAPRSQICHKIGRALGIMKPLNYYYGIRNGLLFQRRHLPDRLWYPFFAYYLVNRTARYMQLVAMGRADLAKAGVDALSDFLRGRTGKWASHRQAATSSR